jgi:hypothetical protein
VARVRVGLGAHASAPKREPFRAASTACIFGSQVFYEAKAFNANIGVWNTASVTALNAVCAAFTARYLCVGIAVRAYIPIFLV